MVRLLHVVLCRQFQEFPTYQIIIFLSGWYTTQRVTSYELISLLVEFIGRVTSYELFLLHELRGTFCMRVTSYCLLHELRVTFIARVTSCCLFTSYELLFIARVRSYFLHTSYELLFIARVTSYFYCTSYELLFIARVTSYCLLNELRVTVYCTSYESLFVYELRINLCMWVTSYFLTMSYTKDKMIKLFMITKLW